MSAGQTIILSGLTQRMRAHRLIDIAPQGAVLNIREAKRTNAQNDLMWAILSQIARAKPDDRLLPTDTWKALAMEAAGFQCTFGTSLDGQRPVPLGFKSSRLTKGEFSDVIETLFAFAAEKGIPLSDEAEAA